MQTWPTSQCGFGGYLLPAASMHLCVTSQSQPILVTSSLASEDSEVSCHPIATLFDVWLVIFQLALRLQIARW